MNTNSAESRWRVVVEFTGLDLDDDDVLDSLTSDPNVHVGLMSADGITNVDAAISGVTFDDALTTLLDLVANAVPNAGLVRVIDPLVTLSDIADEVGVTRQAVRNWALGLRQSGFPRPLAVVGDGVRIWREADVDRWLTDAMNLGTGLRYPTSLDVARWNLAMEQAAKDSNGEPPEPVESGDGWNIASDLIEVQSERIERPRPQRRQSVESRAAGRR